MMHLRVLSNSCKSAIAARRAVSLRALSSLSFATPESDFTSQRFPSTNRRNLTYQTSLSYATPESDFTAQRLPVKRLIHSDMTWSHTLSFSSPESDFCSGQYETMQDNSLPHTYAEALQVENRPLVVTTAEAPHSIVHVNKAWESLCGYTAQEAIGKTLRELLQRGTPSEAAHVAVRKLLETGKPQDLYVVNTNKQGREFINHVTMGPLFVEHVHPYLLHENEDEQLLLVGILEEVSRDQVPLRMTHA